MNIYAAARYSIFYQEITRNLFKSAHEKTDVAENLERFSTTSVYFLTSPLAVPGCLLVSHPKTLTDCQARINSGCCFPSLSEWDHTEQPQIDKGQAGRFFLAGSVWGDDPAKLSVSSSAADRSPQPRGIAARQLSQKRVRFCKPIASFCRQRSETVAVQRLRYGSLERVGGKGLEPLTLAL